MALAFTYNKMFAFSILKQFYKLSYVCFNIEELATQLVWTVKYVSF